MLGTELAGQGECQVPSQLKELETILHTWLFFLMIHGQHSHVARPVSDFIATPQMSFPSLIKVGRPAAQNSVSFEASPSLGAALR